MENPFARRATEHVRDDEAFLALITPEPVQRFLSGPGANGQLYDRLVVVRGTPGSGKTTLATLFEYPKIATLLRHGDLPTQKALVAALTECRAIDTSGLPRVAGCRIAMESDYREIWQFPYPDELKVGLTTALIQARAVLGWMRNLRASGIDPEAIQIVPRTEAHAAIEAIGGSRGGGVLKRARAVEMAIYRITAALIPPAVPQLEEEAVGAYRPLDVIDRFSVETSRGGQPAEINLTPLLILDDAHYLHQDQLLAVQEWLRRRELRVGRWILARLDVLTPKEVLAPVPDPENGVVDLPGITESRDVIHISLQGGTERRQERTAFRKMSRNMADRYLRQWPLFASRSITSLSAFLQTTAEPISTSKVAQLEREVGRAQEALSISDDRRVTLEQDVRRYGEGKEDVTRDVQLAMLKILMHRVAKRRPQPDLFGGDADTEPARPVVVNPGVAEGARIHLMHAFDRPYYYGVEALCDASSENAEQFLHLTAVLVELAATQIIRGKRVSLTSAQQHRELRRQAGRMIEAWNFPLHRSVRRLADAMAIRCVARTLEPNASLGPGPNAFGVRQAEFDGVVDAYPDLAQILQFGVAYNALTLVPRYSCKNEEWCIIELGGVIALHHGLAFHRGNFIESTLAEVDDLLRGESG